MTPTFFLWASQIALNLSTVKVIFWYSTTRCTCYLHRCISNCDSPAGSGVNIQHNIQVELKFSVKFLTSKNKNWYQPRIKSKVKLVTIVKDDLTAPFSIATTPRCRGEWYSFLWVAPLYPWSIPYNTEWKAKGSSPIFWVFGMIQPEIEPWSSGPLVNTLTIMPITGEKVASEDATWWHLLWMLICFSCKLKNKTKKFPKYNKTSY